MKHQAPPSYDAWLLSGSDGDDREPTDAEIERSEQEYEDAHPETKTDPAPKAA